VRTTCALNPEGVVTIRPAAESDLDDIWSIQSHAGQAAQWNPADYLSHLSVVAVVGGTIAGFAVARRTAPDELEILNVAVDPPFRRRGVARKLIQKVLTGYRGTVFLEVRQSNTAARKLYHSLGFETMSVRGDYYSGSGEPAIVMKFHSC
jgi:ribosomal-protein-alanine N-acetyltransferase